MSMNPYQASAEPSDPALREPPAAVEPFVSASPRAMVLLILFALFAFVLLAGMGVGFYNLSLARRVQAGSALTQQEFELSQLISIGAMLLQFVAYLSTVMAYLVWLHRAYRNLPALGASGLDFTPRSAVLWWFCPIANLVVPFRVVRQTWQASNAASYQAPGGWKNAPTSILLNFWWASWLISLFVSQVAERLGVAAESPDGYAIATIGSILLCLLYLVASLLAALVVRRIDLFQRRGEADPYAASPAVN